MQREKGTLYVLEGALRSSGKKEATPVGAKGTKERSILTGTDIGGGRTTGATVHWEERVRREESHCVSVRVTADGEKCAVMDICAERFLISATRKTSKTA